MNPRHNGIVATDCWGCGISVPRRTFGKGRLPRYCSPSCKRRAHHRRYVELYGVSRNAIYLRGSPERRRAYNAKARARARWTQARKDAWRRRYAAKRGASGTEQIDYREIYARDGWRCQLCRRSIDRRNVYPHPLSPSIDHIIPLTFGGSHLATNLQAAHLRCNIVKGTRIEGQQLRLVG